MDIIRDGIIMAVYVFVIITIYIFISGPFDDMMTGFEDVDLENSDSHIEYHSVFIRLMFDMVFAGLIIGPSIWFIFRVFMREPDWSYK